MDLEKRIKLIDKRIREIEKDVKFLKRMFIKFREEEADYIG